MYRSLLFVAVLALVATACGGDDSASVESTAASNETTSESGGESESATTGATEAPANENDQRSGTVTVDGEMFEFTDVFECQIGQDGGSPDYREFGGRSADGSATLTITYFPPEDAFAGLTGVVLDREVGGNNWTYASSYAGSEGVFTIDLAVNGGSGTSEVGVVGVDQPYAGDTLISEWSFSC